MVQKKTLDTPQETVKTPSPLAEKVDALIDANRELTGIISENTKVLGEVQQAIAKLGMVGVKGKAGAF